MNKRYQEFIIFNRRGKFVVFLFCLAFLLLASTIVINTFRHPGYEIIGMLTAVFGFICFTSALITFKKSISYLRNLEAYFIGTIRETDLNRIKLFHKLLDENLFEYHFQPIINVKTGAVFAYEALMRTDVKIGMSPMEILDFAAKEDRLYDVERLTFANALKIMKENSDTFQSKKLFINSISNHLLEDSDFNSLYREYGQFFENIVIEITELSLIDDAGIKSIQKRLLNANCQLALDDYGTGYSNELILLNTNPNYIKIDRSILKGIQADSKKQHLVSNIINFASHNNIKTIAEGIETFEEFLFVINLGVDYVQGFYTGKPTPVFLQTIPDDCIDTICELNRKRYLEGIPRLIYETADGADVLSLASLMLGQYTDVYIQEKEITLQGGHDIAADLNIHVNDNLKCNIILDNVNMQGSSPVISVGHNCSVTLTLVGDNIILNNGIRVPKSSNLIIAGEGNLTIRTDRPEAVGIGGNHEQSYGNITLAGSGIINIIKSGSRSVAIGGAHNEAASRIELISGAINIDNSGLETVCIGNITGNALVKLSRCSLKIRSNSKYAVGIGCLKGAVGILINADMEINIEGRKVVAVGAMDYGTGNIDIYGGRLRFHINAHTGTSIGGIGGKLDIEIHKGDIDIYSEGTDIVGIGDYLGTGKLFIRNGVISVTLFASHPVPIGNTERKIIIDGGSIGCDLPADYKIVNSYGATLKARTADCVNGYNDRIADYKVYLPDE